MEIVLDFNNINSKDQFHDYLKKEFTIFEYDRNLDALYDELSSITYSLILKIKNINIIENKLGDYVKILKEVLNDLNNETPNINVYYE